MIDPYAPLTLDFALDSLLDVRRRVQAFASAAGLSDLRLYYFVVAVNEIMTNAIHHGGGAGRLVLWRDDHEVHCEIVDGGPGIAAGTIDGHLPPPPDTLSGRGLWLARQICDRVNIDSTRAGTRVTL